MSSRPRLAEVPAALASAASADGDRDTLTSSPPTDRDARISVTQEPLRLPVSWMDGLLTGMLEIPLDQGREGAMRSLIRTIERLIPEVKVGISLPSTAVAAVDQRQVFWTEPPKSDERVIAKRVYPEAGFERTIPVPGWGHGGALTFASDEDVLASEGSPQVQLMERAAYVVAEASLRVATFERAAAAAAELKLAEAQVVQAQKLASFGQVAAGMVHELNNPLTAISAYTDFLMRRSVTRGDADDTERLRRIAESANRMLSLTRDLVSYARPSGDVPIAVEVNGVVERALAFCEHELAGVTVERAFEDGLSPVRGLPDQLAQVFVNLVTNACHAMTGGSGSTGSTGGAGEPRRVAILRVTTSRAVDAVSGKLGISVVVEDTGSGIKKEHIELVFNPFFTTKGAGLGTGLGLSIVKNIVAGHGGHIRAESDAAVGTRFIVHLPVDSSSLPPILGGTARDT